MKRKILIFLAVAVLAIVGGIAAYRTYMMHTRDDRLRAVILPQKSYDEWQILIQYDAVRIKGGWRSGYVWAWYENPRPQWWAYTYRFIAPWPKHNSLPRAIVEKANIDAAAILMYGEPLPGFKEHVVSGTVPFAKSEVIHLLESAGWESVSSQIERQDKQWQQEGRDLSRLPPIPQSMKKLHKDTFTPREGPSGFDEPAQGIVLYYDSPKRTIFRWSLFDFSELSTTLPEEEEQESR